MSKLKNLSVINWLNLLSGTSKIKYNERGFNISIKNEDNSIVSLNCASNIELSLVRDYFQFTTFYKFYFLNQGDTILNGQPQIDSWGTNRYGYQYVSYTKLPIVTNTYHGINMFTAGSLVQKLNGAEYTVDHGFNNLGVVTDQVVGPGYFKISWLQDGTSYNNLFPYN